MIDYATRNKANTERLKALLFAGEGLPAIRATLGLNDGPALMAAFIPIWQDAMQAIAKGDTYDSAMASVLITTRMGRHLMKTFPLLADLYREAMREREAWRDMQKGLAGEERFKLNRGRPSSYTHDKGIALIAMIETGVPLTYAAKRTGISFITIQRWRERHPEFATSLAHALTKVVDRRRKGEDRKPKADMFSEEVAAVVLGELAKGRTLYDICKAEDLPDSRTIKAWAKRHPDFAHKMERACHVRSEAT